MPHCGAVCGCGRAGDKTGCTRRPEGGIGYVLPVPLLEYGVPGEKICCLAVVSDTSGGGVD